MKGVHRWIGAAWLCLAATSCATWRGPTIVDAGMYGATWAVLEWRGLLVELRTDAGCTTKRSCTVQACVTVADAVPVCRLVKGEEAVRPPSLTGETGEAGEAGR